MQNTKGYNQAKLTVNYYPSPKAVTTYTLFEDDLVTPTPKGGNKGMLLTFTGDATQKKFTEVTILSDGGTYRGKADAKTITLVVHAQKDEPRSVTVDGKNARFTYDKKDTDSGGISKHFEKFCQIVKFRLLRHGVIHYF